MKLNKLQTNKNNPRTLKDEAFERLLNKILAYPNLLSKRKITFDSSTENVILGGNQRKSVLTHIVKNLKGQLLNDAIKTAQDKLSISNDDLLNNSIEIFTKLQTDKEIPAEWLQDIQELSDEEKKAFVLIDNLNDGDWDLESINEDWDIDTEEWGVSTWDEFNDDETEQSDNSKGTEAYEDDYETPEESTIKTDVKLGDLFEFYGVDGQYHRLLCGDSTDKETVELLMDGKRADCVFSDPPYRIQTDGGCNGAIGANLRKQGASIEFISNFTPSHFLKLLPFVFEKKRMNAYVFCNKELLPEYLNWATLNKYSFNVLVWKKPSAIPIGGSHYPDIEYLLLFRKSAIWNGGIKGVSYTRCLEYGREGGLHPTMKPIPLIANELQISSNKNSLVFDFFLGSGSTMVASHQLNRNCYGLELKPKYCQVIVDRMIKLDETITIKKNGVDYVSKVPF